MTQETQATLNQDGSLSIKDPDNKTVKYVKEADLGAVKVQLKDSQASVTKLQTDLADATTKFDTEHQVVLQERVAKEQLEKDAKEGTGLREKVTGLETELTDLKKASGDATTKLTEQLKASLKATYKIEDEKLADKALVELESIQSALQLTGAVPASANYDGKGGGEGAGDLAGKSPLALAALGYEKK